MIVLRLAQTELGERHAVLMVSVRVGDRALPLAWCVEEGEANIGFDQQRGLLERVEGWLPDEARVLLLADRFYPSVGLLSWLKQTRWHYRLRLKGKLTVDVGRGGMETVGDLAAGVREGYEL